MSTDPVPPLPTPTTTKRRRTGPAHHESLERLLTTRDVAEMLRLHEKTVRRMVREGRLPCLRLGRAVRFKVDDILRWLSARG